MMRISRAYRCRGACVSRRSSSVIAKRGAAKPRAEIVRVHLEYGQKFITSEWVCQDNIANYRFSVPLHLIPLTHYTQRLSLTSYED